LPGTPEAQARQEIDRLLEAAGWHVCDAKAVNLHAARGVAIREFELTAGHGTADYLLYVDGKAAGVIEAKKVGATLTGVEVQSGRYAKGLPASLPAWRRPLPFVYESTGIETHFTNGLDLDAKARNVFAFHRPEMLAEWLAPLPAGTVIPAEAGIQSGFTPPTFLTRVRSSPNGASTGSGPPRSRPSATWRSPSPPTARAPSSRWPPAAARPSPPSASSTG